MERQDTGILLSDKNIKLHRMWFKQMTDLLGLKVLYRAPKDDIKKYNLYGEMNADEFNMQPKTAEEIEAESDDDKARELYEPVQEVWSIYDEHPTQKTMRKLGWNAEMADSSVIIHVPYDLEKLQAGALFWIPAGIDSAEPRLFRVLRISNIAVYPASVACELGPVLVDTMPSSIINSFDASVSSFNILNDESEDYD